MTDNKPTKWIIYAQLADEGALASIFTIMKPADIPGEDVMRDCWVNLCMNIWKQPELLNRPAIIVADEWTKEFEADLRDMASKPYGE